MNRIRAFAIGSCLGLLATAFMPSLNGDEFNKLTKLTLNEPVAIPGKVLQCGDYWLRMADTPSNRRIVQIWNEDQSQLESEIVTVPIYRNVPTGDTKFTYWEQRVGTAPALRAWYYPGDNYGQQFEYPEDMATQLAQANGGAQAGFQAGATAAPSPDLLLPEPGRAALHDCDAYRARSSGCSPCRGLPAYNSGADDSRSADGSRGDHDPAFCHCAHDS